MARFDVYRMPDGGSVLDCQSDLLRHLNTRLVVPLMKPESAPFAAKLLNPSFVVDGETVIMVTQYAATIGVAHLKHKAESLGEQHAQIMRALDALISDA